MKRDLAHNLLFSLDKFDDWKIRMQVYLSALHDEMWEVISDGPIKILKVNPSSEQSSTTPSYISKQKVEWTPEDRIRNNLDNIAMDILFKAIDDATFPRVRKCKTAKEVWEVLIKIGEGDEQEKENKLTIALKKFEDFKMQSGETIADMEARFIKILGEIVDLG
ncbi:uncharacterized protein LOC116027010 [Ipomoea triloba]|uniref:uncharacterized protein LOC116027010 n=1 Tax=Ipomoea triloba TaxID=35885 RepID=UPI00125E60F5|nr:uncharacterized protein LOC116027010 [Ipomoea triloba]